MDIWWKHLHKSNSYKTEKEKQFLKVLRISNAMKFCFYIIVITENRKIYGKVTDQFFELISKYNISAQFCKNNARAPSWVQAFHTKFFCCLISHLTLPYETISTHESKIKHWKLTFSRSLLTLSPFKWPPCVFLSGLI